MPEVKESPEAKLKAQVSDLKGQLQSASSQSDNFSKQLAAEQKKTLKLKDVDEENKQLQKDLANAESRISALEQELKRQQAELDKAQEILAAAKDAKKLFDLVG